MLAARATEVRCSEDVIARDKVELCVNPTWKREQNRPYAVERDLHDIFKRRGSYVASDGRTVLSSLQQKEL